MLTPPKTGSADWSLTVLYAFTGGTDGGFPQGPLTMDSSGALYGVATNAFKLAPPGAQGQPWNYQVIYHFSGSPSRTTPSDGLALDQQGNLFGSAPLDSVSAKSVIFKLTPSDSGDWIRSVIYQFNPTSNCYSGGPLTVDAHGAIVGAFSAFATTTDACSDSANEYAFQLAPSQTNPNVWVKTEMHGFASSTPVGGYYLTAPLTVDAVGNVYGATLAGGPTGDGTIFVLHPRAGSPGKWNYALLSGNYALEGPNGGLALDSHGVLYGTSRGGGKAGDGSVFSLTP
jgi:uncharacterized repeat protein (TIGR03803 family)